MHAWNVPSGRILGRIRSTAQASDAHTTAQANRVIETVREVAGGRDNVGCDLYVMSNPRIPGELKVGRSGNAEMRRCALSAQQNFQMKIEALFYGLGHLEKHVHSALQDKQSPIGTEWFSTSLKEVVGAIQSTAQHNNESEIKECLVSMPLSELM